VGGIGAREAECNAMVGEEGGGGMVNELGPIISLERLGYGAKLCLSIGYQRTPLLLLCPACPGSVAVPGACWRSRGPLAAPTLLPATATTLAAATVAAVVAVVLVMLQDIEDIEAAQDIEDELRVDDVAANITEGVSGDLHPLAVVVDGGIALRHGVELVTQEDGVWGLVGLEEALDGDPELTRGLIWWRSKVENVGADRTEEPTANTRISNSPSRVSGSGLHRAVDVQEETKFHVKGGEEWRPLIEVGVLQFQG